MIKVLSQPPTLKPYLYTKFQYQYRVALITPAQEAIIALLQNNEDALAVPL